MINSSLAKHDLVGESFLEALLVQCGGQRNAMMPISCDVSMKDEADGNLSSEVQMTILELVCAYWIKSMSAGSSAFWLWLAPLGREASFFCCSFILPAPQRGWHRIGGDLPEAGTLLQHR